MDEEYGTKWLALETKLDRFEAWVKKAKNGDPRADDTVIEIDLNDDDIQGQIAIVSWRWEYPLPERNVDRVREIRDKVRSHGYRFFLLDLVSVDQTLDDKKIQQVRAFTKLYGALPVVSFYPINLRDGYQQRGWINYEKSLYLDDDRVHSSTAIMPEFKGVVSGMKLRSLYEDIYGSQPNRVPSLLFLSYKGWQSFLKLASSTIKRRPPKEIEGDKDSYVVADDRPVLLIAYLAGTYFTNYLDHRFTWLALTEKHQLRLPEHTEVWGIEEEEGILLQGIWWLLQLLVLGKKKSMTLEYKREHTPWVTLQENFEKRGFKKLPSDQILVWSNDNIELQVTATNITCTKLSANADINDWAVDAFEALFPV